MTVNLDSGHYADSNTRNTTTTKIANPVRIFQKVSGDIASLSIPTERAGPPNDSHNIDDTDIVRRIAADSTLNLVLFSVTATTFLRLPSH